MPNYISMINDNENHSMFKTPGSSKSDFKRIQEVISDRP